METQVYQPVLSPGVPPVVSVIIVSLNTLSYLQQAIASVARGFRRYSTEIIVVDNGSTDGSVEYVASLPQVRLIANTTNRGFVGANNQALEIMRGRHCFLLNSDAVLHEACGDILVDFLLAHPRVGLVVSTFEYPGGRWQASFGALPDVWNAVRELVGLRDLEYLAYQMLDRFARSVLKPKRVGYGEGAGLLIRDEARELLGGFSTQYFSYSEDVDYSLRAARAGWQIWWVPAARLTHVRGATLARKGVGWGVEVKLRSYIQFLGTNYSPRQAYAIFVLKCLSIQRMLLAVNVLAEIPTLRPRLGDRPERYRCVRDLYWRYLPQHRFQSLLAETTRSSETSDA